MAGPAQGSYLQSETAAERNIFYILSIIWNWSSQIVKLFANED